MNAINSDSLSASLRLSLATLTTDSNKSVDRENGQAVTQAIPKKDVSISAEAKSKLIEDHYNVDDIDASNLPTGIKKYLSAIREYTREDRAENESVATGDARPIVKSRRA